MARLGSLPRPVVALGVVSLLNDLASEMIYPLLPLFLTGVLGAGALALGTIEGLAESLNSLLKAFSGRLSDRLARRKGLVVTGYALSSLARPLIATTMAVWHVVALRGLDRIGKGVRTAPRDALIADATPEGRRGLAYAAHRGMDHLGALLGPLVAAALLAFVTADLRVVFALAAVPAAATLATLAWGVREPPRSGADTSSSDAALAARSSPTPPRVPAAGSDASERDAAAPAAAAEGGSIELAEPTEIAATDWQRLRWTLIAMFVFTLGNSTDAFLLLRAYQLGVNMAAVPLLWAAFHLSKALWSVPGGAWADATGPRRAIVAGWLVYAATYLGFAAAATGWHVWGLFILYGLHFGLTEGPERALVASMAAPGGRGRALGAYHLAVGIGALPASLGFGFVWERWGPPAAFAMGAILGLCATLVLLATTASGPPESRRLATTGSGAAESRRSATTRSGAPESPAP